MRRLGISIYPEHASLEENKKYIEQAAKYGFKRIFTCLLSVDKPKEEIKEEFKELIDFAHQNGMEVIMDVAPYVFERLGISYDDLSFFSEIDADGIRLDEGFDGHKEALMTYNPNHLKIEFNASVDNKAIDNIMSYKPNTDYVLTCHNFYPQRYSGLSYKTFEKTSKQIRKHNLPIAAFVSGQQPNTFGPWNVYEGLCTLEMHRDLPIDLQARHLFATGLVDDVLIANCFASEEEMTELAKIEPGKLTFKVDLEGELAPAEEKILYEHLHFVRGDMNEYAARSTMPRITFKDASIPPRNTRDLKRGDIVIVNDNYDRYKGELHVILKDMPNDGKKNVVGHLPEQEMILLEYLDPWKTFGFMK